MIQIYNSFMNNQLLQMKQKLLNIKQNQTTPQVPAPVEQPKIATTPHMIEPNKEVLIHQEKNIIIESDIKTNKAASESDKLSLLKDKLRSMIKMIPSSNLEIASKKQPQPLQIKKSQSHHDIGSEPQPINVIKESVVIEMSKQSQQKKSQQPREANVMEIEQKHEIKVVEVSQKLQLQSQQKQPQPQHQQQRLPQREPQSLPEPLQPSEPLLQPSELQKSEQLPQGPSEQLPQPKPEPQQAIVNQEKADINIEIANIDVQPHESQRIQNQVQPQQAHEQHVDILPLQQKQEVNLQSMQQNNQNEEKEIENENIQNEMVDEPRQVHEAIQSPVIPKDVQPAYQEDQKQKVEKEIIVVTSINQSHEKPEDKQVESKPIPQIMLQQQIRQPQVVPEVPNKLKLLMERMKKMKGQAQKQKQTANIQKSSQHMLQSQSKPINEAKSFTQKENQVESLVQGQKVNPTNNEQEYYNKKKRMELQQSDNDEDVYESQIVQRNEQEEDDAEQIRQPNKKPTEEKQLQQADEDEQQLEQEEQRDQPELLHGDSNHQLSKKEQKKNKIILKELNSILNTTKRLKALLINKHNVAINKSTAPKKSLKQLLSIINQKIGK